MLTELIMMMMIVGTSMMIIIMVMMMVYLSVGCKVIFTPIYVIALYSSDNTIKMQIKIL